MKRRTLLGVSMVAVMVVLMGASDPAGLKKAGDKMPEGTGADQDVAIKLDCPLQLWSGAENDVTVTIRNGNEKSVEYYPRDAVSCVDFEVTRGGKKVDKTAFGHIEMDPVLDPTKVAEVKLLRKGEILTVKFNLTRFVDLSVEGKYEIKAKWSGKIAGAKEWLKLETAGYACDVDVLPAKKE